MESICQINDYRQILNYELTQRKARNSRYSLRAFARDLELSPSMLSEVIKGRHGFSSAAAKRVAANLELRHHEVEYFCDLVESQDGRSEAARTAASARLRRFEGHSLFSEIEMDTFRVISNWYHFAILDLLAFDSFKLDPTWIAAKLKIEVSEAEDAIERLKRLGIVKIESGKVSCDFEAYHVGRDTPSRAIRQLHDQIIVKARQALHEQKPSEREFNSSFVSIDPEDISFVKCRMREFHNELLLHLSKSQKKSKLCVLSTQFFKICDEETQH